MKCVCHLKTKSKQTKQILFQLWKQEKGVKKTNMVYINHFPESEKISDHPVKLRLPKEFYNCSVLSSLPSCYVREESIWLGISETEGFCNSCNQNNTNSHFLVYLSACSRGLDSTIDFLFDVSAFILQFPYMKIIEKKDRMRLFFQVQLEQPTWLQY